MGPCTLTRQVSEPTCEPIRCHVSNHYRGTSTPNGGTVVHPQTRPNSKMIRQEDSSQDKARERAGALHYEIFCGWCFLCMIHRKEDLPSSLTSMESTRVW